MPYIANITLFVGNYDKAIAWYSKLGFKVVQDEKKEEGARWVTIRPPPSGCTSAETTILLAEPVGDEQKGFVGNQAGGKVFLILATDDFDRDHKRFSDAGVEWEEKPRWETYGKVAVWKDLEGNLWDLIQYT